jgi:hypothetical protein
VGIQENVMVYWKVLPDSLKFIIMLVVGTSFFSSIAMMGILNDQSVRSDIIASSMSFVNMHDSSRINLTWDQVPFVMVTSDGSLMTVFHERSAAVSPYPLTIPLKGSQEIEGRHYFVGDQVEEFEFKNNGTVEVYTV